MVSWVGSCVRLNGWYNLLELLINKLIVVKKQNLGTKNTAMSKFVFSLEHQVVCIKDGVFIF